MRLDVDLLGSGRGRHPALSPRPAVHEAGWRMGNRGFVVCWLQLSSGCFVIVNINRDQWKK
jgi:hypothetical protein